MRGPGGKRAVLAGVLVVLGMLWIAAEPAGKGPIIVGFTRNHGVDVGDIPAIAALTAAVVIARPRRRV